MPGDSADPSRTPALAVMESMDQRHGRAGRPRLPETSLLTAYLAGAALLAALYFALPAGSTEQSVLYLAFGGSATIAIVVGVVRHRPAVPAVWLLLAGGQALFTAGDSIWAAMELGGEVPSPSIADVAYLAGYPLWAGAFLVAIRQRVRGGDRAGLLDGTILACAVGLVGWVTLVRPILDAGDDPLNLLVSVAYPLGDLTIIGVVIGMFAAPGVRGPSFTFASVALTIVFVADVGYAITANSGEYAAGGPLDLGWILGYVLTGAAALHPSMCSVAQPYPVPVAWLGRLRIALLAIATLTGPLIVVALTPAVQPDIPLVAAGSGVLSLLVLARLSGVVQALARDNATRRRLEDELSFRAAHDPLTGLVNRRGFVDRSAALVGRGSGHPTSILFLDLDDFKTVNDSMGHPAGDALLVAVASRLRSHLRDGDIAARLGGDEFAVLLDGIEATSASAIAGRLLDSIREPFAIGDRVMATRVSIGVADGSRPGMTADELLRDADIAMYEAKALGKGRVQVFAPGMHTTVVERLRFESDLATAVERHELALVYQPITDTADGTVVAMEALVRWDHPERGRLEPAEFLALADQTGAVVEIGEWVVREACRQLGEWRARLDAELRMSVNLSPRQVAHSGLVEAVRAALVSAALPGDALIIEITESVLIGEEDAAIANLHALRALGVRVAIDDFGTGYSSLSYLGRLPADIVKVDRAFVSQLVGDGSHALAAAVIRLGETLGLETVAEGIEQATQLEVLRQLGCRYGQGFYIARPMPAAELEAILAPSSVGQPAAGRHRVARQIA